MVDLVTVVTLVTSSGIAGWFGKVALQSLQTREERSNSIRETDLALEIHKDDLTFKLLEAVREELRHMQSEVTRLRPLELHIVHFEEALNHIEHILFATPEVKPRAEANARAFLNRMRNMQTAAGTLANEEQREQSKKELESRGIIQP